MTAGDGPPWLTIVTVVKDDAVGFTSTAESIASQDVHDVQWVVIDSSTDPQAIPQALAGAHVPADYEWVQPSGVYPAMNEGLRRASGEYVLFLNAGDRLHTPGVLCRVRSAADANPTWIYGQVRFIAADGSSTLPPAFDYAAEKRANFNRGRFPQHQGTIVRTDVLRSIGGFDARYRIAADYFVSLRLSQLADPVEISTVVADFHTGGLSSAQWQHSLAEFHRARVEVFGLHGINRVMDRLTTLYVGATMALARLAHRV